MDVTSSQPTDAAAEDIHCPLCDYNLRGLTEARCPECGHRSTWEELRNRPPLHPYLFEHHPEKNVSSFVRTVVGSLLPCRFWRKLPPTMPLRPPRLFIFAVVVVILALISVVLGLTGDVIQTARDNAQQRKWMAQIDGSALNAPFRPPSQNPNAPTPYQRIIQQFGSMENYEATRYPRLTDLLFWQILWQNMSMRRSRPISLWRPTMIIVLWGPLTMASLMIFRVSLRQAKIKTAHVVRTLIYSGCIIAMIGPYMAAATSLLIFRIPYGDFTRFGYVDHVYYACVIFLLILTYRLAIAYRLYLRFPQAFATVLASQIIVALILLKLDMMMLGH